MTGFCVLQPEGEGFYSVGLIVCIRWDGAATNKNQTNSGLNNENIYKLTSLEV